MDDRNYLDILSVISDGKISQALLAVNENGNITFSDAGDMCFYNLYLDNQNLKNHTIYCMYSPSYDDIKFLESCGCKKVRCGYEAEEFKKHKCKFAAKLILLEKERKEIEDEDIDDGNNHPISVYKAAVFNDYDSGHTIVKLCDLEDEMHYAKNFSEYVSDEIYLRKSNIPSLYENSKWKSKIVGSFTLKYRVGLVRTEFNSVHLVMVTNANQHEDVANSQYFIKWLKPWIEKVV